MRHLRIRGQVAHLLQSHKGIQRNNVLVVLCLAIVLIVLASCGSAPPVQARRVTPSLTPTLVPASTPTPTPQPAVTPQPTPSPPASTPPILDVRPSSMSIVGHLDCNKNGAYVCLARVLSRSSNQSNLNWVAFTNVPGQITFNPASGVLAPGQSTLITITVPLNDCTPGLFFFQGPANTHTITWAC
jgi:hypothetical protein